MDKDDTKIGNIRMNSSRRATKKKLLFVAANTLGQSVVNFHAEADKINEIGLYKVIRCYNADRNKILHDFMKCQPHLVHFCGHCTEDGLQFINPDNSEEKDSVDISNFLTLNSDKGIECIFFNCCDSNTFAKKASYSIQFAIGADGEIDEIYSKNMAARFYQTLSLGQDIGKAFLLARSLHQEMNYVAYRNGESIENSIQDDIKGGNFATFIENLKETNIPSKDAEKKLKNAIDVTKKLINTIETGNKKAFNAILPCLHDSIILLAELNCKDQYPDCKAIVNNIKLLNSFIQNQLSIVTIDIIHKDIFESYSRNKWNNMIFINISPEELTDIYLEYIQCAVKVIQFIVESFD